MKLGTLQRLQRARKQLRDVAAARAGQAAVVVSEARAARTDAEEALRQAHRAAEGQLLAANGVLALERVAMDLGSAKVVVRRAEEQAAHAAAAERARRKELQRAERSLRQSDELCEREKQAQSQRVAKHEQRVADDLAATRFRRFE